MAIGHLLKINNTTPPKLSKYTVQREKLFTDAGRNLKGELKATLVGIFPKLNLEFAHTNQVEMSQLIDLLEPAILTVQWWDERTDSIKTGNFYASSYDIPLFNKTRGLYSNFSVNLISYTKLT